MNNRELVIAAPFTMAIMFYMSLNNSNQECKISL